MSSCYASYDGVTFGAAFRLAARTREANLEGLRRLVTSAMRVVSRKTLPAW